MLSLELPDAWLQLQFLGAQFFAKEGLMEPHLHLGSKLSSPAEIPVEEAPE